MIKDFYIKNMVCDRCIKVLRDELNAHTIELLNIELGRITLDVQDSDTTEILVSILDKNGFSLIDNPELHLVEQIKIEL